MEFNKITSELSFMGCSITQLNITNNIVSITEDVKKKFGMDVELDEYIEGEDEQIGRLLMKLVVELEKEEEKEGKIELELEGVFSAAKSIEKEKFISMVLLNGATTLLSVGRSKLEAISALTFHNGKILVPMVNMYQFYEEKRKNR